MYGPNGMQDHVLTTVVVEFWQNGGHENKMQKMEEMNARVNKASQKAVMILNVQVLKKFENAVVMAENCYFHILQ